MLNKINAVLLILVSTIILIGCSASNLTDYYLEDKVVVYNGEEHTLEYHNDLKEVEVEYTNNKHTDSGEYIVTAIFKYKSEVKESSAKLIINKIVLNPYFINLTVSEGSTYDFVVNGAMDIDYDLEYYDNGVLIGKPSVFGNYTVKAIFNNTNSNIIINDIEYDFNISLSAYNQSIIDNSKLEDTTLVYNGRYQYINVSNANDLRDNRFVVEYTYNNELTPPKEIGVYNVEATIYINNKVAKKLNCTLTIVEEYQF